MCARGSARIVASTSIFVSGRGECVCCSCVDVKVDTSGCDLGEDVANLRFELGVESSAMETELVRGVAHAQLLKLQNSGQFPDEPLSRG